MFLVLNWRKQRPCFFCSKWIVESRFKKKWHFFAEFFFSLKLFCFFSPSNRFYLIKYSFEEKNFLETQKVSVFNIFRFQIIRNNKVTFLTVLTKFGLKFTFSFCFTFGKINQMIYFSYFFVLFNDWLNLRIFQRSHLLKS